MPKRPIAQVERGARLTPKPYWAGPKSWGAISCDWRIIPHDERMTRLADRMGIMVWSEVPVYWMIEWENPATLTNATNQLEEMIRRDRNKASVVLWSVANETPNTPAQSGAHLTVEGDPPEMALN